MGGPAAGCGRHAVVALSLRLAAGDDAGAVEAFTRPPVLQRLDEAASLAMAGAPFRLGRPDEARVHLEGAELTATDSQARRLLERIDASSLDAATRAERSRLDQCSDATKNGLDHATPRSV